MIRYATHQLVPTYLPLALASNISETPIIILRDMIYENNPFWPISPDCQEKTFRSPEKPTGTDL